MNASPFDSILVIIPVRNEEATLAAVIRDLQAHGLHQIRVVDNGSRDRSASIAAESGAERGMAVPAGKVSSSFRSRFSGCYFAMAMAVMMSVPSPSQFLAAIDHFGAKGVEICSKSLKFGEFGGLR